MTTPTLTYSTEHEKLIADIVATNIPPYTDYLYTAFLVVITTYPYERPADDLIRILSNYPLLDNKDKLLEAMDKLLTKKWLLIKRQVNIEVCCPCDNIHELIAKDLNNDDIGNRLFKLKKRHQADNLCAIFFGLVSGNSSYSTMIGRLKTAQNEICLPILNMPAYCNTIDALKERASNNVSVKLLIADDKIVKKIKNNQSGSTAGEWGNALKGIPNVEIRIYDKIEYAKLASSVIIDSNLLRLVAYDPIRQRSTNGTLVEFYYPGHKLNVVEIFSAYFYEAWNNSYKATSGEISKWSVRKSFVDTVKPIAVILLFTFMYKFTNDSLIVNLISTFIGISLMVFYNRASGYMGSLRKSIAITTKNNV